MKYYLWVWCSIGNEKCYPAYYVDAKTNSIAFDNAKLFETRKEALSAKKGNSTAWICDPIEKYYFFIIGHSREEKSGMVVNKSYEKVETFDRVFNDGGNFTYEIKTAVKKYSITTGCSRDDYGYVIADTFEEGVENLKLHDQFRTNEFTENQQKRMNKLFKK